MNGCSDTSTTFGFLTHSDQFTPEVMQGTRAITFDNCGRRFSLNNWLDDPNTVSGRNQNWLDADGSASGLSVPSLIVSGVSNVSTWWEVDSNGRYSWMERFRLYLFGRFSSIYLLTALFFLKSRIRSTGTTSFHRHSTKTRCTEAWTGTYCNVLGRSRT